MSKNVKIPVNFLWHPIHFLALGFGSGLAPKMPGTWGTLMALVVLLIANYVFAPLSDLVYLLLIFLSAIAGIYICGKTASDLNTHDHGGIVWDEFVGFWLTMFLVPFTWYWLLVAFVLFRFFDIVKPWPIRWIDKRVGGGFGIMLDDVIAAVYAWLIIQLILLLL